MTNVDKPWMHITIEAPTEDAMAIIEMLKAKAGFRDVDWCEMQRPDFARISYGPCPPLHRVWLHQPAVPRRKPMSDEPGENAVEYNLVMTFRPAVQSGTGPFEDRSFVAGYQAGQIMRSLEVQRAVQGTGMEATVYTDLIPQLDLIAMTNGFVLEYELTGAEGWSFVKFVPPGRAV